VVVLLVRLVIGVPEKRQLRGSSGRGGGGHGWDAGWKGNGRGFERIRADLGHRIALQEERERAEE